MHAARRRTLDLVGHLSGRRARAPDRPDHEPARVGPRPHRGVRGPVARAPLRGRAAAAPGARRASTTRSRRRAPSAARSSCSTRPRRRVPRRRARARPARARGPRARPGASRDGDPPRAPAHRDDAPGDGARRRAAPASRRCVPSRPPPATTGSTVPGGPFAMGAGAEGFAYDNERPRARGRRRAVPDRPPAGHERHVDALRRGRRLRAPRVVVRRGLGVEGGVRHHPRPGGGRRGTPTPPRATSPGSRPTPSPARTVPASPPKPSGRGRRPGIRGPTDRPARSPASGRCGSGRPRRSAAIPASGRTPTASTPRCSSATATASCAAGRGPPPRGSRPARSATGTCPSAARSSRACAWRRTPDAGRTRRRAGRP